MFKKSLIIFLIIILLGINFSNILTVKAQTYREERPIPTMPSIDIKKLEIPSAEQMEPVLSSAPESFEVSLEEILICNTGIYSFITDALNSFKAIVLNPVCQLLGREVSVLGTGGTVVSGMCTINVGGADSSQACKQWVQQKKAIIKAKMAEMKKIALRAAAKSFADHLVYDIVDWIGGEGEDNNPQFITNWRDFFSEVADDATGRFIKEAKLSKLCEPFRFSVQLQLQTPGTPGRPTLPTCTLSDVVNNIESFYEDFNDGGWFAFEEASYPWNNSIGAMLMVNDNLALEIELAKEAAEKETQSGYKPTKYCLEVEINEETGEEECVKEMVSIPGDIKSNMASKAITQQLDKTENYLLTESDLEYYEKLISNALVSRLIKIVKESEIIGNKSYSQGLLKGNFLRTETTPATATLQKYSCKEYDGNKVCEPDSNGSYQSKKDCEDNCESDLTSSIKYLCNGKFNMCYISNKGEFSTKEECDFFCSKSKPRWKCIEKAGACVELPSVMNEGVYFSPISCQNNCNPPRYSCNNGACVPDDKGNYTYATCKIDCKPSVSPSPTSTPSVKYLCNSYNDACYISDKGEFSTEDECDHYCEELNPLERWSCNKDIGSCVKSFDGKGDYIFQDTCNSYCKSPTPSVSPSPSPTPSGHYRCDNGICVPDEEGEYTSYSSCIRGCKPSVSPSPTPSVNYSCYDGQCVEDEGGEYSTLRSCISACEPSVSP